MGIEAWSLIINQSFRKTFQPKGACRLHTSVRNKNVDWEWETERFYLRIYEFEIFIENGVEVA